MYSKDELTAKNTSELQSIASEIGADISGDVDNESMVYAILDKQAEIEGNKNPLGVKRRRTRIAKKDTDHVYSVSGRGRKPRLEEKQSNYDRQYATHRPGTNQQRQSSRRTKRTIPRRNAYGNT